MTTGAIPMLSGESPKPDEEECGRRPARPGSMMQSMHQLAGIQVAGNPYARLRACISP